MTNKQLWRRVLSELELNLSQASFNTWFKNTSIASKEEEKVIVVNVPNGFVREWLENKYRKYILKALQKHYPKIKKVDFIIRSPFSIKETLGKLTKKRSELSEVGSNIEKDSFEQLSKDSNLNPRYTFKSFVVGSCNELAHAASLAVSKSPGKTYNPLFIYGGVGLGKTHLLQAIGNELIKRNPTKQIKYSTCEQFTNELINAIKKQGMNEFKNKYRKIDILIVDDVQFLSKKEKTQEEFFHTFNTLYENNKQIILSSDRPPKAISTLEERLRSRFEGGMITDIGFPDIETRLAILKVKVENREEVISQEILEYIASHIQNNIRELEGALNKVIAYNQLNNNSLDLKNIKGILASIIKIPKNRNTTPSKIIKIVTEFYDIKPQQLFDKNRKKQIAYPRQIAMYLMREEAKLSYPSIGEKFSNRDHTTVLYACRKINKEIEESEAVEQEINTIKDRLYNDI